MDLRYALLTLLKILVSTPLLYCEGAALLGHPTASRNTTNSTADAYYDYELTGADQQKGGSEEIPDPSPLVVSGYNLPETIFNRGKPFYVEKDPLTGKIDFAQKTPTLDDELYDYVEEPGLHDKSNIDRKDTHVGGHRHTDVNQLTPNFHDFLNLPVKYSSAKYVYPLISSSYASTKVQGSVSKFHNHKDYNFKTSTSKPSPTYFSSSNQYFSRPQTTAASTTRTTTTAKPTEVYFTTKSTNLLDSGMGHPSFQEEFGDYYDVPTTSTSGQPPQSTTSEAPEASTTTKKTMSLFEQLFGEYDDVVTTTKTPSLFANLPGNKHSKNKYQKTEKPQFPASTTPGASSTATTTTTEKIQNSHAGPNVLGLAPEYEYEDYAEDDVAEQNKPVMAVEEDLTVEPLLQESTTTEKVMEVKQNETVSEATTTTTTSRTTTSPGVKVTSLPLGDNHLTTPSREAFNRDPIIVATQNLREKLNSEKVMPRPFEKPPSNPPSASNIHIAPNQDTVSFVVGNQQSVEGTTYVGTALKENPYDSFVPQHVSFETEIQPLKHSEASLAIGVPVQVPGRVVDDNPNVQFPQVVATNKVVFPEEKPPPNRELLTLNSQPMYHQLPSDLTPPKEARPPWDPRPGHFYTGKPEYNRPPRPPVDSVAYKRIDNLPNILPQFRPNMNKYEKRFNRQPLLERPSNRPVGFFEKLLPPPPPPPRKQYLYRTPPQPPKMATRRNSEDDLEAVETLQMLQVKHLGNVKSDDDGGVAAHTEKTIYKVYPVNSTPLKLDAIDTDEKESVVIGTRAEPPLPPSKIHQDFVVFDPKQRQDSPVLKPHARLPSKPLKTDFPYLLERPNNNQWNAVERSEPQVISATLKTSRTEKPIAVAYTPTEPDLEADKFSMPNFGSPVIPEILPGDDVQPHAVADRADEEERPVYPQLEFQAPFLASDHVDSSMNKGWAVVKNRTVEVEVTTLSYATTSEFDMEHFQPQLEGGFKPIYSFPEQDKKMEMGEREER